MIFFFVADRGKLGEETARLEKTSITNNAEKIPRNAMPYLLFHNLLMKFLNKLKPNVLAVNHVLYF